MVPFSWDVCVCEGCLVVLCELDKGLVAQGQYVSQRVFRWFMANEVLWGSNQGGF